MPYSRVLGVGNRLRFIALAKLRSPVTGGEDSGEDSGEEEGEERRAEAEDDDDEGTAGSPVCRTQQQ